MSITKLILGGFGYDLFERPNGRVDAWEGSRWIGYAFPTSAVFAVESGWTARVGAQDVRHFASRHQALAFVVGGCPSCICDQPKCRAGDSGVYCELVNCGACLHGCPEDECDMTERS